MYPLLALDLPEGRGARESRYTFMQFADILLIIIIIIIITNTISEFKIY